MKNITSTCPPPARPNQICSIRRWDWGRGGLRTVFRRDVAVKRALQPLLTKKAHTIETKAVEAEYEVCVSPEHHSITVESRHFRVVEAIQEDFAAQASQLLTHDPALGDWPITHDAQGMLDVFLPA